MIPGLGTSPLSLDEPGEQQLTGTASAKSVETGQGATPSCAAPPVRRLCADR
jgi:hypothetical protein